MKLDAIEEFPLEEELKKKTMITKDDIKKLRVWLETQPHLPGDLITDLDLLLTFHCCHRSAEVAKQVLDLHFTLRTLFTNLFKDRDVDEKTMKAFHSCMYLPLETRAYDGSAVIHCRLLEYEPKKFHIFDSFRAVLMVIDLWQYEEGSWPGFVIIIDLDRLTLGHLPRLELQAVQQFLYYLQEAMLVKLKGLHFLNAPSFMDKVMMIIRPFMKKELLAMMNIHQIGAKTIGNFLPIEALPKDSGGEYITFQQAKDDTIARIEANKDYFLRENKKRVVESLRPGKPKTITDIFGGIEGSFKKLDID